MKRHEAWRVYGALMCAAGLICMYEHFKMLPASLSPTNQTTFLKSKLKVLTTLFKLVLRMICSPVGTQGATDGHATMLGVTDGDLSSRPRDLQNKDVINVTRTSRREVTGCKFVATSI